MVAFGVIVSPSPSSSPIRERKDDSGSGTNVASETDTPSEPASYGKLIVIALIVAIGLRLFVLQAVKIPSASMLPTLAAGDHVLINKLSYGIQSPWGRGWLLPVRSPRPGEVIVFANPVDRSQDYIKRVVAVAGEVVELRNKRVLVNGQPRDGAYAFFADGAENIAAAPPRDNYGPAVVPPHKLFVLGDNRDQSIDSRYWGFVDVDDVLGRADMLYWSWDGRDRWIRWQLIRHDIG
jgi:signal peptidase I